MKIKAPSPPAPTPLPVIGAEEQQAAAQRKMAQVLAGGKNTTTNSMGFLGSASNPGLLGSAGSQIRSSLVTG